MTKSSRVRALQELLPLFRGQGYDGASMAGISAATGLGRSSLYHHFPGGKAEMAGAVLDRLMAIFEPTLEALADGRTPQAKLDALLGALDEFYDSGRAACLLERLSASVDRKLFARPLERAFAALIHGFETIALAAGVPRREARDRAEAAVVSIEGSLVVATGVGDPAIFVRALERIRGTLLLR